MTRPSRKSIFDNLTPEQQVLWDAFSSESVGAAKLTVQRSRRRPIENRTCSTDSLFGINAASLELWRNAPEVGDALKTLTMDDIYNAMGAFFPHAQWTSPSQRGRHTTKRERARKRHGVNGVTFMSSAGQITILPDSMCPEHTAYLLGDRAVTPVGLTDGAVIGQLQNAAERLAELGGTASRATVSPRSMASVNREMAMLRTFDSSYQR